MILTIIYILSLVFIYYLKSKGKISNKIFQYLHNYRLTTQILIVLIVIGFFFNLDYSDLWGCIISHQLIFGKYNILFSSVALTFTVSAIVIRKKSLKTIIHITELFIWIGKLIIFKGGYAVGFGGTPLSLIVLYDFIVLFLRLLVIRNIWIRIRSLYLSLFSLIIILIKIYFFPTQQTIHWEYKKSLKNSGYTMERLQGKWSGYKIIEDYIEDTIIKEIDLITNTIDNGKK